MKTLAAPTAARFADHDAAGAAVVELVRLGTPAARLRVGLRDPRAQHAFAQRFGVAELPRPRLRSGLTRALEQLTAGDDDDDPASFESGLIAEGIGSDTARALDHDVADGVLVVVPADAPAEAMDVLIRHGGDFGSGALHYTVPLREERLDLRRRMVEEHAVEVRTEVITETRSIEVELEREEVVIERRSMRADGTWSEPEEVRIPTRHEEVLLTKQTVVTAQVEVRKERHVDVARVSEDVRHEEVRIDVPPAAPVHFGDAFTRGAMAEEDG